MFWKKRGLIFDPHMQLDWSCSHAQLPIADPLITQNRLRIYYSTRNEKNQSLPAWVDVRADKPTDILEKCNGPLLKMGEPGAFDDNGVMPSCIVNHEGKKYMYYVGWSGRKNIPYHNSVGLAVSTDHGSTWTRYSNNPLWEPSVSEPHFSGTSCVRINENGVWQNWYLSCSEWREVEGKKEPRYNIKYATSLDGIHWSRDGHIAINYKDSKEGGLASASVVKIEGKYHMWFSYRGISQYRTDVSQSYRIGYAVSADGMSWIRKDEFSGIEISRTGWDAKMICYPNVVKVRDRYMLLYNGNGFGYSGFGFATTASI